MKRSLSLPFLVVFFLATGSAILTAEELGAPFENLSFEQIDNFRKERKFTEIIAALQPEDLSSKAGDLGKDVDELYSLRGLAYQALKEGSAAEADYKRALAESPDGARSSLYWFGLAENYRINLSDPTAALSAYQKTIELCFQRQYTTGWLPISATISAAGILCSEAKFEDAATLLQPYDELIERIPPVWQIKLLRASAEAYKGQGKEDEANARLQRAQDLEATPGSTP